MGVDMFENGAEIVTATVAFGSVILNFLQAYKHRKTITWRDCETIRAGCDEIRRKAELVDDHAGKILIIQENLKLLAPASVVTGISIRVDNIVTEIKAIRDDFVEGRRDRVSIRDSMQVIKEHIKVSDSAIRVFMRLAKDGSTPVEALEELLKVFDRRADL